MAKTVPILSFVVLAAALVFMAVWGGGAFPSSMCIVGTVFCAVAALALFVRARADNLQGLPISLPVVLWLVIMALLALSALPLPGHLDILTGFRRYEQNQLVRKTLTEALELGRIKAIALNFALTRNRAGTLRILILSVAMLGAAILAGTFSPRQKRVWILFLMLLMTIVAVAGVLHQWVFPARRTLWWLWKVPHGRPVGCFINRTHHAGFLALVAPVALAMLGHAVSRKQLVTAAFAAVAYLAISFGILVSLSRGAALAHAASSATVLVLLLLRKPTRGGAVACLAVAIVIACSAAAVIKLPDPAWRRAVIDRLETLEEPTETDSAQWRFSVWRDSLRMWRHYPMLGVGANGFRMVHPIYREGAERQPFSHTENEFVSVLVETGIVGVLLVAALVVAIVRAFWRSARTGKIESALAVGTAGAIVTVAVHNSVDFPLHAPVYAILFASLIGCVLTDSHGEPAGETPWKVRIPAWLATAGFATAAAFIVLSTAIWRTVPYKLDSYLVIPAADRDLLARILVRSPTSGEAWIEFAKAVMQPEKPKTGLLALSCAAQATRYDPNNYRLWGQVGKLRHGMGDRAGAAEAYTHARELRPWLKMPDLREKKY